MPQKLVVIAKDCDDTAQMIADKVSSMTNFRAIGFKDGAQALKAILKLRPRVAILDIELPSADGLFIAREVRQQLGDHRPLLWALKGCPGRDPNFISAFDHVLEVPANMTKLLELLNGLDTKR